MDVELQLLKKCKDLTMKLKVEHHFPTSSSGSNFCIYQLPEGLGTRKITWWYRMRKNPQTREDTFWIFSDFHGVMQFQLAPLHVKFINGIANQGFPNSGKEWGEIRKFAGENFLLGGGNLRKSDFDQSNLSRS